jgi:hypothetical protein
MPASSSPLNKTVIFSPGSLYTLKTTLDFSGTVWLKDKSFHKIFPDCLAVFIKTLKLYA